jgi:cobalamin synthase
VNNEPQSKGKKGMSQKAQEALGGIIPRWATAIAMAVCAYFLSRLVHQVDTVTAVVQAHAVSIAQLSGASQTTGDALGKLDQITRLLELRLARMESKEEQRKP